MAVSVIIPANGDSIQTIAECIESIRQQIRPLDTITLISSEYKQKNIQKLKEAYPNIELISSREKMNPAKARNIGGFNAKNEWLLFIDCDCTLSTDYFNRVYKLIEKPAEDFIGCAGNVQPQLTKVAWSDYENLDHIQSIKRHITTKNNKQVIKIGVGANMLVKKNIFIEQSGFNEKFDSAEDRELGIRLFLQNKPLAYEKNLIVYHKYEPSLFSILKRHLWHAKGNALLYSNYSELFDHPIKKRINAIQQLLTEKKRNWWISLIYVTLVGIPYIVYFAITYYRLKATK